MCDDADAYILVTDNITVGDNDNKTKAAFKNCHSFPRSEIHLNGEHVETADNLDLIMNMYNLTEYSDNYSDSTASLYHFKRQQPDPDNADLTTANSSSFKYKSRLVEKSTLEGASRVWKNAKIMVTLKYIGNFFSSLEMPLINTKLYLQLNWTKEIVISDSAGGTEFKITKTELYVPVVTLKLKTIIN